VSEDYIEYERTKGKLITLFFIPGVDEKYKIIPQKKEISGFMWLPVKELFREIFAPPDM